MKQLFKKYNTYIDSYEYDEEFSEAEKKSNFWVYLKDGYETDFGSTCIHDNIDMIRYELEDIHKRYGGD